MRTALCLLVFLCATALGDRLHGEGWPGSLTVDLEGFEFPDGDAMAQGWRPLRFAIKNEGTRAYDLAIELQNDSWRVSSRVADTVTIAPGAERRIWLYFWGDQYQNPFGAIRGPGFQAEFYLSAGSRRSSARVLTFTDSRLFEKELDYHTNLRNVLFLSPTDIAPDWRGLCGADKVLLYDLEPARLTLDQTRALEDYVYAGGELIIVPTGAGRIFQSPWLAEFLGLLGVPQQKTLAALPETNARYATFTRPLARMPAFQVLVEGGVSSTLAEAEGMTELKVARGRGSVRVMCIPFDTPEWEDREVSRAAIYDEVLGMGRNRISFEGAGSRGVSEVRRALNMTSPPSSLQKVPVLVIYLFAPILLFFHYRRKREEYRLLWGLPVLAVGFALLVFLMGYVNQGWTSGYRLLSITELGKDHAIGIEQRYLGVFSARGQTMHIGLGRGVYARSMRDGSALQDPPPIDGFGRFRDMPIALWEMAYCAGEAPRRFGDGIDWSFKGAELIVKNRTPFDFGEGLLVLQGNAMRVPELPRGHELAIPWPAPTEQKTRAALVREVDDWTRGEQWQANALHALGLHPGRQGVRAATLVFSYDGFGPPDLRPELEGETVSWLRIPLTP